MLFRSQGKVVIDKRVCEELQRILSCFNIHLDNPIIILPQDTAKTMLFSFKPSQLYNFFIKATQLEDLENTYDEVSSNFEVARRLLIEKDKHRKLLKIDLDKCEKQYQFYITLDDKKRTIDMLKNEEMVALRNEATDRYDDLKKGLDQFIKKVDQIRGQIEKRKDEKNGLSHQRTNLKEQIENMANSGEDVKKQAGEFRNEVRNVKSDLRKLEREVELKVQKKNTLVEIGRAHV